MNFWKSLLLIAALFIKCSAVYSKENFGAFYIGKGVTDQDISLEQFDSNFIGSTSLAQENYKLMGGRIFELKPLPTLEAAVSYNWIKTERAGRLTAICRIGLGTDFVIGGGFFNALLGATYCPDPFTEVFVNNTNVPTKNPYTADYTKTYLGAGLNFEFPRRKFGFRLSYAVHNDLIGFRNIDGNKGIIRFRVLGLQIYGKM